MGLNTAIDLASNELGLETSLTIHLRSNHYPPVPHEMVPVCIAAIDAYWEMDTDRLIQLPEATSWWGEDKAPAWAIIEGHHLESWCQEDYEDEE
jgi:hypothetical protein